MDIKSEEKGYLCVFLNSSRDPKERKCYVLPLLFDQEEEEEEEEEEGRKEEEIKIVGKKKVRRRKVK